MSRAIKFRAWNKDRKEWAFLIMAKTRAEIVSHIEGEHEGWQQFTGLLDKNGKEIYEGDIVQVFYHDKPQIDENKAYTVVIEDIRKGFSGVGEGHGEVIGNIYENPELLP